MKKVIMMREKISQSKEYLVNPETLEALEPEVEVWENRDCEPFWNEYYGVAIFDDEKWEDEHQALCEDGEFFYNSQEAKAHYNKLKAELEK